MNRKKEIRELLRLAPSEMVKKAKGRLTILGNLDQLHRHFAKAIASEISTNNEAGRHTLLILPVGPTGQYPVLAEMINKAKISLKNCRFFFMDEYCDENGHAVPASHPLSFKGEMEHLFFSRLDPVCGLSKKKVVFPDHLNIQDLGMMIEKAGGLDTCYAGLGIHGHLAFNEPEPGVKDSEPRLVYVNKYTITINAIRAGVGGNLESFPRQAATLGLRQILSAQKIRIYCRNDIPGIDWANTILRLALFGEPGDDYPVTYIRNKDYHIVTTRDTAAIPKIIL